MSDVAELEDVGQALRLAAKVDYTALPPGALIDVVAEVQQLKARLAALESAVVGAYDASGEYELAGHRTAAVAIRHQCRVHGGEAAGMVRLGRDLRTMPAAAALRRGTITARHADRLGRAATRPEFVDAEELLLGHAYRLSFTHFDRAVSYWEQVVDDNRHVDEAGADEPAPRADPRETNRRLHLSRTLSDMGRLDGWLDPVGHATVAETLRRIETELFEADWALAKEEHGEPVTLDHLWRTPAQRRADALVEMATRASAAPADGKRPLPQVIVHVDAATFEATVARLAGEGPVQWPTDRLCELDDGTVISPDRMLDLAMAGTLRRIVYESPGVILDFGREQRFFKGALRQAIQARDRVCDHDGCEIPARHCDIDHVIAWEDGGHTSHRNGKARCNYHHTHHKPSPG